MSSQSFQAVRRLQDAGAPLPLVLANPAWQALMDKVDSNICERSSMLQDVLNKVPLAKRPILHVQGDSSDSLSKRARVGGFPNELDARKQALLSKLETIQGVSAGPSDDSYEAYRQQCWIQYYEWMEQQKQGASMGRAPSTIPGAGPPPPPPPEEGPPDEDEEIHNALLGLS